VSPVLPSRLAIDEDVVKVGGDVFVQNIKQRVIDIVLEGAGCASHPEVGNEAFEKAKPRDERRLPLVPWGDAEPVEGGSDVELREEFSTGQGVECLPYEGIGYRFFTVMLLRPL